MAGMPLWGSVFWASLSENGVSNAAYCALAILTAEGVNVHGPLPTAGLAAVYAVLGALTSRHVGPGKQNGTASFNPHVVASSKAQG